MITESQIREISRISGIRNPHYQEKEYLQMIFLYSLFKKSRDFIFKGGTCLKLVYNIQRFSEDLDFNSELLPGQMHKIVIEALKAFPLLGIDYEIVREQKFEDSYTAKICFKGPLYKGIKRSENSIQIDVGKRGKIEIEPRWGIINSPYPDIPSFPVLAMNEREILAEKVRALHMRSDPKDLFDIWSIMKRTPFDKELIIKKLSEKGLSFGKDRIIFCGREKYEKVMENLLPIVPEYEQIAEEIKEKLSQL